MQIVARPAHVHDHPHPHGLRGAIKEIVAPHSHDAADSVDDALESSAAGIRAVKISLLVLGLTAIAQIVVVIISGSVALAADTIHNFSDALTAVPLWIAFALGTKAATRRYTYGLGRAEDLAGLFVIAMITLSAIIAGYEAIMRLTNPEPIEHIGWVALAGLIGFIGNEWVAVYRIGVGRRVGSAALVADGLHARTDGLTSLAVVLAAGGVALGFPLADPIIGLVITVAILAVLRIAVRDVFRRLLDGVDPKMVDTAEQALAAQPWGAGGAQCADALDRAPHARGRRTRRRSHPQPGTGAPHRTRRRARAHARRPQTHYGIDPRLPRGARPRRREVRRRVHRPWLMRSTSSRRTGSDSAISRRARGHWCCCCTGSRTRHTPGTSFARASPPKGIGR